MRQNKYIGYHLEDYGTLYAKYYRENISPVSEQVKQAVQFSPYPSELFLPFTRVRQMLDEGYAQCETGYSIQPDGSAHISVLTSMSGVTPPMWDWWFAWHSSHDNRYKLWHPKAHRSARWEDGDNEQMSYIGRTSLIEEYIGTKMEKAAIQFVSPCDIGFYPEDIADKEKNCFICARIGYSQFPLDFGYLVHQVRATKEGSEMRSRFWIGGKHIQLRFRGVLPQLASSLMQKIKRVPPRQAQDLLLHCSEEMNHLAAILPELYNEFCTNK